MIGLRISEAGGALDDRDFDKLKDNRNEFDLCTEELLRESAYALRECYPSIVLSRSQVQILRHLILHAVEAAFTIGATVGVSESTKQLLRIRQAAAARKARETQPRELAIGRAIQAERGSGEERISNCPMCSRALQERGNLLGQTRIALPKTGPSQNRKVDLAMLSSKLPTTGFLRLRSIIAPIGPIPASKSTWWAGIKSGRYPRPVKLGPRITVWRVEDIRALIEESR